MPVQVMDVDAPYQAHGSCQPLLGTAHREDGHAQYHHTRQHHAVRNGLEGLFARQMSTFEGLMCKGGNTESPAEA